MKYFLFILLFPIIASAQVKLKMVKLSDGRQKKVVDLGVADSSYTVKTEGGYLFIRQAPSLEIKIAKSGMRVCYFPFAELIQSENGRMVYDMAEFGGAWVDPRKGRFYIRTIRPDVTIQGK